MGNNIQITVTQEQFEKIDDVNKKLNFLYQVASPIQADIRDIKEDIKDQKSHCENTVKAVEGRIENIEKPKLNKTKVVSFGASSGLMGGIIAKAPEIIDSISNWFHK